MRVGSLEEAVGARELYWHSKGLDDEDAKVVAYVVAVSGSLVELVRETCIHPCASGLGGDAGAREICTCQVCDDPDGVDRAVCVFVRSLRAVKEKKMST